VLDTGALIGLDRGDRAVVARLVVARQRGVAFIVPAGYVAQAVRDPRRQVSLVRLLRSQQTTVVSLDHDDAWAVGHLLARAGAADVVDGHVAVVGRRAGAPILTGDPEDLRALEPSLAVVAI
jgi:predicted nucleic acid-binding protein